MAPQNLKCAAILFVLFSTQFSNAEDFQLQEILQGIRPFISESIGLSNGNNIVSYTSINSNSKSVSNHKKNTDLIDSVGHTNSFSSSPNPNYNGQIKSNSINTAEELQNNIYNQYQRPAINAYAPEYFTPSVNANQENLRSINFGSDQRLEAKAVNGDSDNLKDSDAKQIKFAEYIPKPVQLGRYTEINLDYRNNKNNNHDNLHNHNNMESFQPVGSNSHHGVSKPSTKALTKNHNFAPFNFHEKDSNYRQLQPTSEFQVIRSEAIPVIFNNPQETITTINNNYNRHNTSLPEISIQSSLNIPIHVMDGNQKRSSTEAKIELIPFPNSFQQPKVSHFHNAPEKDKENIYSTLITTASLLPPLRYEDQTTSIEYYPVANNYNNQPLNSNQTDQGQHLDNNNHVNYKYPTLIIKKDKKDFDFTGLLTNENLNNANYNDVSLTNLNSASYPVQTRNGINNNYGDSQNLYQASSDFRTWQNSTDTNQGKFENVFLPQVPRVSNVRERDFTLLPTQMSTSVHSDSVSVHIKSNNGGLNSNKLEAPLPLPSSFIQSTTSPIPTQSIYTVNNPIVPSLTYDFQNNQNNENGFHPNTQTKNLIVNKNYPDLTWQTYNPDPIYTFKSTDYSNLVQETTTKSTVPISINNPNSSSHTTFQLTETKPQQNLITENDGKKEQIGRTDPSFTIMPSIQLELVPPSLPTPQIIKEAIESNNVAKPHHTRLTDQVTAFSGLKVSGSLPKTKTELSKSNENSLLNIRHFLPGAEIIPASAIHFKQVRNGFKLPSKFLQPPNKPINLLPIYGKRLRRQKPKKVYETPVGSDSEVAETRGRYSKKISPHSIVNVQQNKFSNVKSALRHTMHDWPLAKLNTMSRQFQISARNLKHFYMYMGNQRARLQRIFARYPPLLETQIEKNKTDRMKRRKNV